MLESVGNDLAGIDFRRQRTSLFDIREQFNDWSDVQWVRERQMGERIKFAVNGDFELRDIVGEEV